MTLEPESLVFIEVWYYFFPLGAFFFKLSSMRILVASYDYAFN